jgi:hypothetical protein
LLAFVPDEQFTLLAPADTQTTYHFNKKHIDHTFCKICGVQSFGHGHDGNGNYMTMINLTCLDNFDQNALVIEDCDGASL